MFVVLNQQFSEALAVFSAWEHAEEWSKKNGLKPSYTIIQPVDFIK